MNERISFTTISSSMKFHCIDGRTSCCVKNNLKLKFLEVNMAVGKKNVTDKTEWTLPRLEHTLSDPLYMDMPQYVYLFIC